MKIRNPLGNRVSLGNGYAYQCVRIPGASYVKVWHHDRVIDRALTVAQARKTARKHATNRLFDKEV